MGTIKKIQRPFSIEEWRKGNGKVETRDGQSVRLLCIDLKDDKPIIAAITDNDDNEHIRYYYQDGRLFGDDIEDAGDLVIIEEVEEPDRWADDEKAIGEGWYIDEDSKIRQGSNFTLNACYNYNLFVTEKQVKSALAMARISQFMAHDERYGATISDEEWRNNKMVKFVIYRSQGAIARKEPIGEYHFLAFHSSKQRDLFLKENEQLVKDYLMI